MYFRCKDKSSPRWRRVENAIKSVDWVGVTRGSSTEGTQFIPIDIFRWAIRRIILDGSVSRDEINDQFKSRGSSAIVMILAQVPEFEYSAKPLVIRTRKPIRKHADDR